MKLGLQEKGGGTKIFLAIKHDCICQESKIEREGFEPVEVTNPETDERLIRFIKRYGGVSALITKIEWRDTGDRYDRRYTSWRIHLDMGGSAAVLEIPFESRHSTRFMKLAENIDFTKPVEFRAWYDAKNKSTAFYVGQWANDDDEKSVSVPQKYTRAEPNGCPEPVQRLGGKWNFDDQAEFLHGRMVNVVIPKLEAAIAMSRGSQNGHYHVDDDEPQSESNAPKVDRSALEVEIKGLCKQLNNAGDEPKWTTGRLNEFVNGLYHVEDGMDSLSNEYLANLKNALNKRLVDLEVPF